MTGRIEDLVEQALAPGRERLEATTREIKRLVPPGFGDQVAERLDNLLDVYQRQDNAVALLRAELAEYRRKYAWALGVACVATLGVLVALAGKPVWALLRHYLGG